MSTGNLLYLIMCLCAFGGFAAVLAYMSHQQTKLGPEMIPVPAPADAPEHEPAAEPVHA